ncbi:MAG: glycerophosphodiester phosphodiesterase family protein [Planctomycetota bacterium]|nr:glycerophosphodiester phosphodiesterase family protein [Planctomycetota bacterium]
MPATRFLPGFCLLLPLLAGCTMKAGFQREGFKVIAHRGASVDAPENTLVAIKLGIEQGSDGVEFDVYRTSDGQVALMHDKDVLRTTNFKEVFTDGRSSKVTELSLAQLRRLDAGSWHSAAYAGEKVPTLEEALELLRGRSTPVIEIKPEDIGQDVAMIVQKLGIEKEVFVQSFSPRAIREFHEVLPGVTTGYLTGNKVSDDSIARAREHRRIAAEAGASVVVCNYKLADRAYIDELHGSGFIVWVYTVDDEAVMRSLMESGIDGIITNVPAVTVGLRKGAQ